MGLKIERDRANQVSQACTGLQTPVETKEDWAITQDDTMLDEAARREYQAAIGSLMYLMVGTRPDLAFSVN